MNVVSRVSMQEGHIVITLDQETQQSLGIEVLKLQEQQKALEAPAYGIVLQVDDLVAAEQKYIDARRRAEEASAASTKSRLEYERDRKLRAAGIISEQEFEAEEETYRAGLAAANAARNSLDIVNADIGRQWGAVVAGWILKSSPPLQRVLTHQDVLLQITVASGKDMELPATIRIASVDGRSAEAVFVSPSPQSDPRIQGRGYFYIAPSGGNTFLPGMNVSVSVPASGSVRGVIVPEKAVVWSGGVAWCYIKRDAQRFFKQEVPRDAPVSGGWFVSAEIAPGDNVVVSHPQLLLSEESRTQSQAEGD